MSFPVCAYCGSPFPGRKRSKYCNWDCYCKYRKAASLGVESYEEEEILMDPCRFNDGVRCLSQSECDQCGWNPEVAERRLARILAQMFGVEVRKNGN